MIIIADSGSTKTHWCSVDDGVVHELVTQGLNPRLTDGDTILTIFHQTREQLGNPDAVFFYGAGCGTQEMQQRVVALLSDAFTKATCHCEGDLMGACRALCGDTAGMVGILGTGSNLCFYDGRAIALQRTSTGYILGDEGSGNHIGRMLLKDYLEDRMPPNVKCMFHDDYPMTDSQFLDHVYSQPFSNRFLASLAPFAAQHQTDEYVVDLLHRCFAAYFAQLDYFALHRHEPLHLAGGLVRSFLPTLRQVAEWCHVILGTLMPDPMEGLVQYYSKR